MKSGKVIEIRGKTMGGGTPLICTPLVGRTAERVLAEAASVVAKVPDVVEWRVDYFEGIADTVAVLDVAQALRSAVGDLPIVFTRRSMAEGGEPIAIGNEDVVRLYDAVGASDLVEPGVSGFVADGYESLVTSLRAVGSLHRDAVRASAAARFGHERMATAHATVYERAIAAYRAAGPRPSVIMPDARAM